MSTFYREHFSKLPDFASAEITALFELATKLKTDKKNGIEIQKPAGKNTALIFEKNSTHTRCSSKVAVYDRGARVTYLGPSGSQIGYKKSTKDTARVLGRMYDGIQYRGHGQEVVETLAQYAGVPVWNNLTNEFHPTQLLADLPTVKEYLPGRAFSQTMLVYAGDACGSMGNSMPEAATLTGPDLRPVASPVCWPEAVLMESCTVLAKQQGGNIILTEVIAARVKGIDFIYTDAWVPMDETKKRQAERITLLRDYQVNSAMLALTGNPQVKFFHCPPTLHDDQTTLSKRMAADYDLYGGMEVTDEVLESAAGIVSDQAENRMYTIKAVMVATLSK